MANGNGKASTVVSIITSVLMVVVVGGSFLFSLNKESSKERTNQNTKISEVCSEVDVLQSKVASLKRKNDSLTTRLNTLRDSNSQLQRKLGIITEILNRLDKRTKKLEDYIYSNEKDE